MPFNSVEYFIFLPITLTLFYLLPQKYRWPLLLCLSYFFYMYWKIEYLALILFCTLSQYLFAILIYKTPESTKKKLYLTFSVCINLAVLFTFKYYNFFISSINDMGNILFSTSLTYPYLNIILPVGISFYTFQSLGYTIDVYMGTKTPEKHLGIFALFVSFFPQLVAGPIERSKNLLPQLKREHPLNTNNLSLGFSLILWGLFKKAVIADRLAEYVNNVYNNVEQYQGIPLILATYFFAFQIYCDFSGYTDIARGSAKLFGIDLMENFKFPYSARSIREFWNKWHISLSSWFKDYLYIPLGGNRGGKGSYLRNIVIVFLVSGLWHGANWTFLVWGGLHGFFLIFEVFTKSWREKYILIKNTKLKNIKDQMVTFHLVLFAWIFFRANSLSDVWYILKNIFRGIEFNLMYLARSLSPFTNTSKALSLFLIAILLIFILITVQSMQKHGKYKHLFWIKEQGLKTWLILLLGNIILFLGIFGKSSFIYFQF